MSGSNRARALRFIAATHDQIATYAQESFGMHGRGVVFTEAPARGTPTGFMTAPMGYTDLAYIRQLHVDATEQERESAAVVLRMVETYDPFKQAVVMIAFPDANAITVKMRLAEPLIED
jgi:hypothetical protein